ncbi:MAG: prepilin-type N-terminal cleavage/methylation domain-containing protein [Vibrio sp.]
MRGFSLLESLVVVLLISLSLGFATPNFLHWQHKQNVRAFTLAFHTWFEQVRYLALSSGCHYQFAFKQHASQWQFSAQPLEVGKLSIDLAANSLHITGAQPQPLAAIDSLQTLFCSPDIEHASSAFSQADFPSIKLKVRPNFNYLVVNGRNGRIQGAATSFEFYSEPSYSLKMNIHHLSGRLRVCALTDEAVYGYAAC